MEKKIKWIKIIACISIVVGILTIITYPNLEFFLTGVAEIAVGIGLYKLKKWGLYGQIVLIIYGYSSSLYKFIILKNNYFTVPIGMGTYIIFVIGFVISLTIFYKIFWKNRSLFK